MGELAELLIERGRFAEAEGEAREILKHNVNNAQGNRLLAKATYGESAGGSRSSGKDLSTPWVASLFFTVPVHVTPGQPNSTT